MRLVLVSALAVVLGMGGSDLAAQNRSPHRKGPHGLEGWTLLAPIENQGELPMTLVIARDKKIIRRISGDPFVWNWVFVNDGRQVAYESGPLHFSLTCLLADVKTGKNQGAVNCFSEPLPQNAPAWVKQLEAQAHR